MARKDLRKPSAYLYICEMAELIAGIKGVCRVFFDRLFSSRLEHGRFAHAVLKLTVT